MEKSNKRGKIPQSDWPLIMARYEAGETLASIARTYDCSPPAISYVVSKSRARQPSRDSGEASPSGPESQLIKSGAESASDIAAAPARQQLGNGRDHRIPGETTREANGFLRDGLAERGPQPSHSQVPAQMPGGAGNERPAPVGSGTPAAAPSRNEADTRHRLHLSLGNGTAPHNGSSEPVFPSADRPSANRPIAVDNRLAQAQTVRPPYPAPSRAGPAGFSEAGPGPGQTLHSNGNGTGSEAAPRKEGAGLFIDYQLRARVDTDIAAFLAAFDAALTEDTQDNRSALREATDRLLRAGARTRIELERLEARVPLTAHDRGTGDPGAWRYR
jgi:hypothetical protein